MSIAISNQETSENFELNYNESDEDLAHKPTYSSASLVFFKDLWKVRFRDKTKLYFIMYILGLGMACGLIAIDIMTFNTIDPMTKPFYDYYTNPYSYFYITVYSEELGLTLSPQKSEIIQDLNNFFKSQYHFSFELKNSMKEMKNYLNSLDIPGIGSYLGQSEDFKSTDIYLMNKNSDYALQMFYLSMLKFIIENETTTYQKDKLEHFLKERSNSIQFSDKEIFLNDDNANNNSIFINLSTRIYAHPKMRPSVGYESLTAFYVILALYFISIASSTIMFKLNKEKVLFYLKINGLTDFKMYSTFLLCSLLETLPCTIITSLAVSYIPETFKGTSIWIVLISTFLLSLGRTFFDLISTVFFMRFDNFGVHYIFILLLPAAFLILSVFKEKVPDVVFVVFSLLSPSQAYMLGFSVMSKCKAQIRPLTFSLVNEQFNGFSMVEVFCFQFCNTLVMLLLMVIFMMNMGHLYGHAAIGWRNIFKKFYWSRAFSKFKKGRISDDSLNENQIALKLEDVVKTYKGHSTIQALKGVDCEIKAKESIVMLGPNGSGKSTMIDCVVGTSTIDLGTIQFFGHDLNGDHDFIYENLGIVFQDNVLINELTVDEHFELIGALHRLSKERINYFSNNLLSLLRMEQCRKNRSGDLSGGQKRKLCIALALVHKPPFLIFDEPTAGVDAQSRQIIWKTLSLYNDATSLITSHAIEEAESICSRLFIMSHGLVQFMGTPAELRKEAKCGYILTIIEENQNANNNVRDNLLHFIQERIPDASTLEGKDKSVIFPADLRTSDVLNDIEKSKDSLGIVKYSLNIQNLEESLVKLIENEEVNQKKS